jgi:hypothetical protein
MDALNPFKDGVPFHPALVHLPLGVSILLPGLALLATIAIWRGWVPKRTWWVIVGLQALMVVGGAMAYNTGEKEKDLVGGIVDDAPIEEHEEAAEVFMQVAAGTLVVGIAAAFASASKLAPLAHLLFTALSLVLLVLGMNAGHKGGRLVYIYDAAQAHLPENTSAGEGGGDSEKKADKGEKGEKGEDDDD